MKKIGKYVIFFCFFLAIGFILPKEVYASDGWGTFGDNITWTFTESTGVLELKGSGDMPEIDRNTPGIVMQEKLKKYLLERELLACLKNSVILG